MKLPVCAVSGTCAEVSSLASSRQEVVVGHDARRRAVRRDDELREWGGRRNRACELDDLEHHL